MLVQRLLARPWTQREVIRSELIRSNAAPTGVTSNSEQAAAADGEALEFYGGVACGVEL